MLSDITEYRIQQIIDNGRFVQISLIENVHTEPISQKQIIMDSISKKLDTELKNQIKPLLEAILKTQPTIKIGSYQHTSITVSMPKNRYEKIGKPQVGENLKISIQKIN